MVCGVCGVRDSRRSFFFADDLLDVMDVIRCLVLGWHGKECLLEQGCMTGDEHSCFEDKSTAFHSVTQRVHSLSYFVDVIIRACKY